MCSKSNHLLENFQTNFKFCTEMHINFANPSLITIASLLLMGMEFRTEIKVIKAQNMCDQGDYSPCECATQGPQYYDSLYCDGSLVTVEAVAGLFERVTTPVFDTFTMTYFPNAVDGGIPANFTAGKIIMQTIVIECLDHTFVKISDNAFDSTAPFTTIVQFKKCNLENFNFLNNFSKITSLLIDSFPDLGNIFVTFPTYFPLLIVLTIRDCLGWNHLQNMPSILEAKQLKTFYLTGSVNMDDDATSLVMDWAAQSFGSSLTSLYLYNNNFTKIPSQIEFFSRLNYLDLEENLINIVPKYSLTLNSSELKFVSVSNCGINDIEPDGIQGNFNDAVIELRNNMITRLESSVFGIVFESGGTIDVKDNPLNCDDDPCHLAWLFNQNLINSIGLAKCSNGTLLADLDPLFFSDCNVYPTTESSTSTENLNKETETYFHSSASSENISPWFNTTFNSHSSYITMSVESSSVGDWLMTYPSILLTTLNYGTGLPSPEDIVSTPLPTESFPTNCVQRRWNTWIYLVTVPAVFAVWFN